ncbi:RNA polymerase sigma factor [Pseudoalteromonas sp. T1lg48]|uniref:RNA polymerase sigma factor n=1 Tax=Pseudoalteromonas sp. T1lg48 TaxID=2077100 RepID=UPI000CF6F1DE|nr:RNA polymerase sigma factor [Pseudoalteromonas sp. T1lg48]
MQLNLTIIRAQTGCEQAFTQVYDTFSATIAGYLIQLGVQGQDSDDVQQQTWLTVYKQLHTLSSPYAFKRWLLRIAHHHAYKKIKEPQVIELTDDLIESPDQEPTSCLLDFDIELLGALPRYFREVLYLFYWQEMSCTEIAVICDLPTATVKSRLFHARKKLANSAQIQHLEKELTHA